MITQVQQDMEDDMYKKLKAGGVGIKVITKYPNQSIEELASVLTDGMMMSYVGDIINALDNKIEGFGVICKKAFNEAVLRLLREAKGVSDGEVV